MRPVSAYAASLIIAVVSVSGCQLASPASPDFRNTLELRQEIAELPKPVEISKCLPPKVMTSQLLKRYGETGFLFLSKGPLVYLIYASRKTTTWTIVELKEKSSCIMQTGIGIGTLTPQMPGKGI